MPPRFEENSMELTEQNQTKSKAVMYDDVIPPSKQDSDLREKPKRPVVMYDDINFCHPWPVSKT